MLFRTEIKTTPLEHRVVYGDGMLFLGSCFADEVGNSCKSLGFNAMVNPFGPLYNPSSIAQALRRIATNTPFTHEEVIKVGNGFHCTFSHNTAFWRPTEEELLETVNQSLEKAHEHYQKTEWVIVSLGTSWVFRNKATGEVVANCHKLPANRFDRVFFSTEQTRQCLSEMVGANGHRQFIFTVSPLRHLKDGMHQNQLSKAALLMAVDDVCGLFGNTHYFPAYEILLDELRDYRFYKEDMVHPTEQAVRYIWEKFIPFAIEPSELPALQAAAELRQMLSHKPLFPESEEYHQFEALIERKTRDLRKNHPRVCLDHLNGNPKAQ